MSFRKRLATKTTSSHLRVLGGIKVEFDIDIREELSRPLENIQHLRATYRCLGTYCQYR